MEPNNYPCEGCPSSKNGQPCQYSDDYLAYYAEQMQDIYGGGCELPPTRDMLLDAGLEIDQ